MLRKINHILIPILLISLLIFGSYILSAGQTPTLTTYLPHITDTLSDWIGPYGGYIVSIAIDPINPQVMYAGTWGSGVFRTLDGGQNWQPINNGLSNYYINSIAIEPVHTFILYAGTYKSQIYKSVDGGETWTWSGTGMQDQAIVYTIAIDPFSPDILYAGTRGISNNNNPPWKGVVYKSENSGQSWEAMLTDVGGVDLQDWAYQLVVNPQAHNSIYAVFHESGPYQSWDYGNDWSPTRRGITDYSGRAIAINPNPNENRTLYYGVWHVDTVYKSLDGGINWFTTNNGFTYIKVYSLVFDPIQTDTLFMATYNRGVYKTQDGGETWKPSGLQNERLYNIAIGPDSSSNLLTGTAGDGLYRSLDSGVSWQPSNNGLDNANLTSVVISPTNPQQIYASVYGAGVLQSAQHGRTWEAMNSGLSDKYIHALVQNPSQPELIYALTDTNGLYRYNLNTGTGWESIGMGLPLAQSTQPAYTADYPFATYDMLDYETPSSTVQTSNQSTFTNLLTMVFTPSDPQVGYLGTNGAGVYRTTDAGSNWQSAGLEGESIMSLAVDSSNSELIYATTAITGSLRVSQNGGETWEGANLPVTFYSLASTPNTPGSIYAGTSDGIYSYQSNSWTRLGLPGKSVTAIAVSPIRAGLIYAGTTSGAYFTTDGGLTWKSVSDSLNNLVIQSISLDPTYSNWAYFCTSTHGIYFSSIRF